MWKIITEESLRGWLDEDGLDRLVAGLPSTSDPFNKPEGSIAFNVEELSKRSGKSLREFVADGFISKWDSFKKTAWITMK